MTQEPRYLLAISTGKPKKVFIHLTVIWEKQQQQQQANKQAHLAIFTRSNCN